MAKPKNNIKRLKQKRDSSAVTVEGLSESDALTPEVLPREHLLGLDELAPMAVNSKPVRSDTREIVSYDPLNAYLREMRRYPPLSREQEVALAMRYRDHNDLSAAYQLVSSNLWLVVKIAREYERAARTILDVIQEGNMGLMEAVKNFDPLRGVRFPSYAVWWIRAYMVRYLIANWRLVKIGTTQAQRKLFFNLNKEKERLEREGFSPEPKLIADRLNVKESEVIEMEQRLGSPDVSVDAPVRDDIETPLLSLLPGMEVSAEDLYADKQKQQQLQQDFLDFRKKLNKNEQLIFQERLLSEDKATLQDLSDKLSLTKERIRQIEVRIKEKLKSYLTDKYGESAGEQLI